VLPFAWARTSFPERSRYIEYPDTRANVKISGGGPRDEKKKEKSVPRHPLHFFVRKDSPD
jgi:hypothetical protein